MRIRSGRACRASNHNVFQQKADFPKLPTLRIDQSSVCGLWREPLGNGPPQPRLASEALHKQSAFYE
jgi:hypothetical protein